MRSRARMWLAIIGLVGAHLLLQVTLGLGDRAPDLLLVAVLAGSRHQSFGVAALLGMFVGLIDDTFAMTSFGASMVALSATAVLGSQSMRYFMGRAWYFPLCYFGISKVLRDQLGWLFSDSGVRPPYGEALATGFALAALYAALAGLVVSRLLIPLKQAPVR